MNKLLPKCDHVAFYVSGHTAKCLECKKEGLFCYMVDKLHGGKIQNYYREMATMFEGYPEGIHRRLPNMFGISKDELK